MSDPNVIEAVRRLVLALDLLAIGNPSEKVVNAMAYKALAFVDGEIAAEKPAAPDPDDDAALLALERIGSLVSVPVVRCKEQEDEVFARVFDLTKKPAAPAIVPVAFDGDGHAGHWERGWDAQQTEDVVELAFRLRPGEDAGVTTAKMLAACGRGP